MKYVVSDECIGCGLCAFTCPEVFSINAEGKSVAISEDVPPQYREKAAEARDNCPVGAITEKL